MLKLYNTLKRKKEIFKPLSENQVRIYTCGPTVYDYAHIGNFRAYVFADILVRYLKYKGYNVLWVMNITDIDDKTIAGANKKGISLEEYTDFYKKAFFEDLTKLNIQKANYYPEATKHIKEMVELVKILLKKGYAYKSADGSIYFKISKFKNYGKLVSIPLKSLKSNQRMICDNYSKEEVADFVLWKAKKENEPFWKTEIGEGRPGWHLECSVMSTKYLGQPFDIHTGGIDLVFPHHQNEIAQSEAAFEKPLAVFWLHNEHLLVEGQKMSKSLGNFYTLKDIEAKGFRPLALRYLYITAHYRDKLNFTFPSLKSAQNTLENLENFVFILKNTPFTSNKIRPKISKLAEKFEKNFEKSMDDDLNSPKALAFLFDFIGKIQKEIKDGRLSMNEADLVLKTVLKIDQVLGLNLEKIKKETITKEVLNLIKEREKMRALKNFTKADYLREEIRKKGYFLEDTPYGPRWKKIK